jgi:hypothetical protein
MINQILFRARGPIVAIALILLSAPAFIQTAEAGGRFKISIGVGPSTRGAYAEGFRDGYRRGFIDGRDDARFERDAKLALRSFGRVDSAYRRGFENGYERGYRIGFDSIDSHDHDHGGDDDDDDDE